MTTFSSNLPIENAYYENQSKPIDTFVRNVKMRQCTYYASDLLGMSDNTPDRIEEIIVHTYHLLGTLHVSSDEHIQQVYRGSSNTLFKDWKLSKLACVYMLFHGSPDDFEGIAYQQNTVINYLLTMFNRKGLGN